MKQKVRIQSISVGNLPSENVTATYNINLVVLEGNAIQNQINLLAMEEDLANLVIGKEYTLSLI